MNAGQFMSVRKPVLRVLILTAFPMLMFYLCWPWLWQSPIDRIWDFFNFFTRHQHIPTYYFGSQYTEPPWHLPPVLTLLVTPALIVLLFFVGLFSKAFPIRERLFVLANLALAVGIISISPSKHDGIRLFLPAIPFLYLIAGAGLVTTYGYFRELAQSWKQVRHGPLIFSALASFLLGLTIIQSVVRYHPYETAYFNEFVGGDRGAVAHGLEYEYWCGSYIDALKWLDQHSESTFWTPICGHLFAYYYSKGLMTSRLKTGDKAASQYLILPSRLGAFDRTLWNYFNDATPVFSVPAYEENVLNIYALHAGTDASKRPEFAPRN